MHFKKWASVKYLLVILLSVALLFTCKKMADNSGGGTNPVPEPAPDLSTKVTAAVVSGFITNETDAAVQTATVEVGGTTVTTDKYGYFEVRNAQVVQNAATVTVSKTGYFKTVKTFIATAGKSAFFRMKLLPKTNAGSFTATAGGTITLASGMAITIPAAAVVNAGTNAAYTGTVSVAAQLISATDPNLNRIMPGDLRGTNTNGNLRLLSTYGMMAVELTGAGGELLQVASGKKATITMPIPASLQAGAPASIPLWYFDEAKGLWKEEGSAAKNGSNYVGEVSHFSFWNCDVPATYIKFDCTVVNASGLPMPYLYVKATALSSNIYFSDHGYTDSAGYVSGYIPNNAQMKLEIFDNSNCSTPAYAQVFTTANANISLGTIVINAAARMVTLTGSVKNCNNAPVTNGFIMIADGTALNKYRLSNTGTYSVTKLVCSLPAAFDVTGEDAATGQQSTTLHQTVTTAGVTAVPDISACGVVTQEYFNFTDNGVPYSYKVLPDTMYMFAVYAPTYTNSIHARTLPLVPTNYATITFGIQNITVGSNTAVSTFATPQSNSYLLNPGGVVNITEYGSVGQFEAGTFTVSKTDIQTQIVHTFTGNFRVRRTN